MILRFFGQAIKKTESMTSMNMTMGGDCNGKRGGKRDSDSVLDSFVLSRRQFEIAIIAICSSGERS